MIERKCNVCGNTYKVDNRNLKRGWGLCCSKSCAAIKREREKENHTEGVAHLADMSVPNAELIQAIINGLDYVDCTIGYTGIPLPVIESVAENVMINIMAKFNLFLKR